MLGKNKNNNIFIYKCWNYLGEWKQIKTIRKCGERGSNTRPSDLQSDALPTELSPLVDIVRVCIYILYLPTIGLCYTHNTTCWTYS